MSKTKKQKTATIFIDYKPAELKQTKDWLIVYYAKVPGKEEFKRFRKRVPKISNKKERLRYAKKMIVAINDKLYKGWSPFYEQKELQYKTIEDVFTIYSNLQKKELKDNIKRKATVDTISNNMRVFKQFLSERFSSLKFFIELDVSVVNSFLDYTYLEREISPATYNNYLQFLKNLFKWSESKGYISQNPTSKIQKKKTNSNPRAIFTTQIKEKVKKLQETEPSFYTLCMCTYFCFLRRTELTKIKVKDVHLKENYITVLQDVAKNRKTLNITIPTALIKILENHIKTAKKTDFLFSDNKFLPGKKQLNPQKITTKWSYFRRKNNIDKKYQFYGLKNTGITDLLNTGIPSLKVRDQARHHDLKMTEKYASRNKTFDETVLNVDFDF